MREIGRGDAKDSLAGRSSVVKGRRRDEGLARGEKQRSQVGEALEEV